MAEAKNPFKRHDPNQELMVQGVANVVTPFFGGILPPAPSRAPSPTCAPAPRARWPAPCPVTLFAILLAAAPLASLLPLAALAGILLFVAWKMFEGHQFARLRQFSGGYRLLMVGTFLLTIVFDLTVEVGLVLSCVFFIWRMGKLFSVKAVQSRPSAELPPGVHAFELYGSLFFGAVGKIEVLPDQLPPGTRAVVLDMQRLVLMDSSGLDALQQMHRTLQRQGTGLVLANVNDQPLALMRSTGFEALLGAEHIVPTMSAAFDETPR